MKGYGIPRLLTALMAFVPVALLVACDADPPPARACHSALDCPDGTYCSLSTRTCVAPPDASAGSEEPDAGADVADDVGTEDIAPACTDGAACDDGEACTHTDLCKGGVCKGTSYSCDDGLDCTTSVCDGVGGCDYGVAAGRCLIGGACHDAGADPADACRQCVPAASQTQWQLAADGTPCSTDPCATSACLAGSCTVGEASCDDGDPCTDDACGEQGCEHTFNTAPCDDGDPCTGPDTCAEGACKGGDSCLCTCATDEDCTSAGVNPCLGGYRCVQASDGCGSQCELDPTTAVVCDPSQDSACSTNSCDPSTGGCGIALVADGTSCDDGDATTTDDTCEAGVCAGEPACACAVDADCAAVDDGDACNGTLTCDGCSCVLDPKTVVICPEGDAACTVAACDPKTSSCGEAPKADGTLCDDGDPGTTDDICTAGICQGQ